MQCGLWDKKHGAKYRRTGYPRFFPLLNGNVTNLPSANRIPFPPSEYIRNAANVNAAVSKLGGVIIIRLRFGGSVGISE